MCIALPVSWGVSLGLAGHPHRTYLSPGYLPNPHASLGLS